MKLHTKKQLSALLIIAVICSVFGISVISSEARIDETASVGVIETYNLKVGDTKYIFLNESDKAVQSAVWKSNAPFDVEIISQDSVSCQVKVNNFISTTPIITCEYYYQQFNSLTGQIWLIKGAKSFYVKVSEASGTDKPITPETPVVPEKPKGPFEMNEFTAGIYTYVIKSDGTAEVTDYEPKLETSIRIPKWMDDYDTTSIGSFAFEYCKKLEKITFPEKVASIGTKAFYDCEGLQTVILPQELTEIGAGAFMYCLKLNEITIPQGVNVIKKETFSICTSLKSITIPEGVTNIEKEAFASCTALEKVVVPESIESIDATAFDECNKEKLILYGYEGTAAESFAKEKGFEFIGIKKLTDPISGITVNAISESDVGFSVNEVTDIATVESVNSALENEIALKIYDVSVIDAQENEIVSVVLPTDNEAVKVYKIESDGSLKKIVSRFTDNGVTFNTSSLGQFVITVGGSVVVPDETTITTEPAESVAVSTSAVDTEPTESGTAHVYPTSAEPTEVTVMPTSVSAEPTETIPAIHLTVPGSQPDTEKTTESLPNETTKPEDEFEIGDVNGDGKLNIKDATNIQKYAAKLVDFDEAQLKVADYNADGKINVKDATQIQKKIANLI